MLIELFPEEKYSVVRVVGGLGHQLFCLSEAYSLHKHTGKLIVLDYSDCEFLDSAGEAHSSFFSKNFEWAILVKITELSEIYKKRYIIKNTFPQEHSYINEGFIANFNRISKTGLFTPGVFPVDLPKQNNVKKQYSQYGAIHFRHSSLYYGNLGNVNRYYLKVAIQKMMSRSQIKNLLVFSNNKSYAMNTLGKLTKSNVNLTFASVDDPITEILMMSKASFLICSNSAMSWWASYFGMIESCFPKPFYLGFWNWEKQFLGPNMIQVNQFRFMFLNRVKYTFLKYLHARGYYRDQIYMRLSIKNK